MSNINYYIEIIAKICKILKTMRWPNYPGWFRNDLPKGGPIRHTFRQVWRICTDFCTQWFAGKRVFFGNIPQRILWKWKDNYWPSIFFLICTELISYAQISTYLDYPFRFDSLHDQGPLCKITFWANFLHNDAYPAVAMHFLRYRFSNVTYCP